MDQAITEVNPEYVHQYIHGPTYSLQIAAAKQASIQYPFYFKWLHTIGTNVQTCLVKNVLRDKSNQSNQVQQYKNQTHVIHCDSILEQVYMNYCPKHIFSSSSSSSSSESKVSSRYDTGKFIAVKPEALNDTNPNTSRKKHFMRWIWKHVIHPLETFDLQSTAFDKEHPHAILVRIPFHMYDELDKWKRWNKNTPPDPHTEPYLFKSHNPFWYK